MYADYVKGLICKNAVASLEHLAEIKYTRIIVQVMIGNMPIDVRHLVDDYELKLCGNPEEMVCAKVEAMKQDLAEFVMQRVAWELLGMEVDDDY